MKFFRLSNLFQSVIDQFFVDCNLNCLVFADSRGDIFDAVDHLLLHLISKVVKLGNTLALFFFAFLFFTKNRLLVKIQAWCLFIVTYMTSFTRKTNHSTTVKFNLKNNFLFLLKYISYQTIGFDCLMHFFSSLRKKKTCWWNQVTLGKVASRWMCGRTTLLTNLQQLFSNQLIS